MNLLTILGIVSMIFVAAFTLRAYRNNTGVGQTPRGAIIEAWFNIGIGFAINYAANLLFLPMVGAHFSAAENWWLGWLYTTISIVRQFALRRWFNARLHRLAQKLAGEA
jgi:hypothetical protein